MRQLANLHDEQAATRLLSLLRERGLEARVNRDADGEMTTWTIWILSEDDMDRAGSLWREFRDHPETFPPLELESSTVAQVTSNSQTEYPISENADGHADEYNDRYSEESSHPYFGESDDHNELDHHTHLSNSAGKRLDQPDQLLELGSIPVTLFIVVFSILVSLISHFGTPRGTRDDNQLSLEQATVKHLALVDPTLYSETSDPLISIKQGEAWRVVSSMFLHFDSLHLAYNIVWLFFLGSALERLEGSLGILKIVVFAHIAGLCAQVFLPTQLPLPIPLNGNPLLLGSSGVVYGLFGYLWLRPKFDRRYPLFLVHSNLLLMIGWLIFCLTPMAQPFANGAQIAGLLAGVSLASLSSKSRPSR